MILMKQSLKAGQPVYHERLGRGVVLDEWGSWVELFEGKELAVSGKGIFEVQFSAGGQRSVNGVYLRATDRSASATPRVVRQQQKLDSPQAVRPNQNTDRN
jgi:hypothetical protein